jgi:hypothetical protein
VASEQASRLRKSARDKKWHKQRNDGLMKRGKYENAIDKKELWSRQKLTLQQKSERGRSKRRVVAQTARKVRDKKEDACNC